MSCRPVAPSLCAVPRRPLYYLQRAAEDEDRTPVCSLGRVHAHELGPVLSSPAPTASHVSDASCPKHTPSVSRKDDSGSAQKAASGDDEVDHLVSHIAGLKRACAGLFRGCQRYQRVISRNCSAPSAQFPSEKTSTVWRAERRGGQGQNSSKGCLQAEHTQTSSASSGHRQRHQRSMPQEQFPRGSAISLPRTTIAECAGCHGRRVRYCGSRCTSVLSKRTWTPRRPLVSSIASAPFQKALTIPAAPFIPRSELCAVRRTPRQATTTRMTSLKTNMLYKLVH